MVMSYFLAQLMPWATDMDPSTGGALLVLGSANVDEALRGYYTKYDCSAADINPIGGINKRDLKAFLQWTAARPETDLRIDVLHSVAVATPSAELTGAEGVQVRRRTSSRREIPCHLGELLHLWPTASHLCSTTRVSHGRHSFVTLLTCLPTAG